RRPASPCPAPGRPPRPRDTERPAPRWPSVPPRAAPGAPAPRSARTPRSWRALFRQRSSLLADAVQVRLRAQEQPAVGDGGGGGEVERPPRPQAILPNDLERRPGIDDHGGAVVEQEEQFAAHRNGGGHRVDANAQRLGEQLLARLQVEAG